MSPHNVIDLAHPISSRLDRLFARWKQAHGQRGLDVSQFSTDGIVNPDEYERAKVRVLFVLKETNDYPDGDLREYLAAGPRGPAFHTLGRWALGLQEGFARSDLPEGPLPELRRAVHQAAFMNLKKITGGADAEADPINEFTHQDQHFLRDQIAIIDPDVIVSCGVRPPLIWLYGLDVQSDGPLGWAKRAGRLFIFMRHPTRAPNGPTYESLRALWHHLHDVPSRLDGTRFEATPGPSSTEASAG